MAENIFQRVAVPDTQLRQSKQATGPDVDVNARQEIANEQQSSLGQAISDLVGIGTGVTQIIKNDDKAELEQMKTKHKYDALADTSKSGSDIEVYVDSKVKAAEAEGEMLDDSAIKQFYSEGKAEVIKNLPKTEYNRLSAMLVDDKAGMLTVKRLNKIAAVKKEKQYQSFEKVSAQSVLTSDDPKAITKQLSNFMNDVGAGLAIEDTRENAKIRMIGGIVKRGVTSTKPKESIAIQKFLDSKEAKEFFKDVPDFKNTVNVNRQKATSAQNKVRSTNFDKLESQVYDGVINGAFLDDADVNRFIKEFQSSLPEGEKADSKRLIALQKRLQKDVATETNTRQYHSALKSGDFTVLDRSDLSKKEKQAVQNSFFSKEVGMSDLSPQGISQALRSGEMDAELKEYMSNGFPLPPAIESWLNTAPSGGVQGLKDKHQAFMSFNALSKDTNTSLLEVTKPKQYGRMMFLNGLFDRVESGSIDEGEVTQIFSAFNNDMDKNVDSFGTYVSRKANVYLSDKESKVSERIADVSADAPWTWDEAASQAYRTRQLTNNFSIAMETTDDPEAAMDLAEEMFFNRHTEFENPDGSESILPNEFKNFNVDDFVKIAENHPELEVFKETSGYFGIGKDFDFKRNLSFKPDPNYEKNNLMNVYHDGRFVMSLSQKDVENNLRIVNRGMVSDAEQRNINTINTN